MKEYLRMTDVFDGLVKEKYLDSEAITELAQGDDSGNGFVIQDETYWIATEQKHAMYAAHAINSHDEIVSKLDVAESTIYEVERVLSEMQRNGIFVLDDVIAEVECCIKRLSQ